MDTDESKEESEDELEDEKEEENIPAGEDVDDIIPVDKIESEIVIDEILDEKKFSSEKSSPRKLLEEDKFTLGNLQPPAPSVQTSSMSSSPIDPDTEFVNINVRKIQLNCV